MSIATLLSDFVAWLVKLLGGSQQPVTTTPEPNAPITPNTETDIPVAKITGVYLTPQGVDVDKAVPQHLTIGRKSRLFVNIIKDRRMELSILTYLDGKLQYNIFNIDDLHGDGSSNDNRVVAYPIDYPGTNGYDMGNHIMKIVLETPADARELSAVEFPVTVQLLEPKPGDEWMGQESG